MERKTSLARLAREQGGRSALEHLAGWIAPAATMIAAMMTASNLGARVTGWGFVVFTIGSIAWIVIALTTGQGNLLWSNAFLTLVNLIGIWRWLGRQARYDDGAKGATSRSAAARVPTLFPVGALPGTRVTDRSGATIGTVVEAMMRCSGSDLAYLVVSESGVAGVGERLHALSPSEVTFSADGVRCAIDADTLAARPVLTADAWPETLGEK
ncbi:hypothetical protein SAMN05192583_1465 [Sphingomonas gellani]|uniref:PRC-barrel domain-containing protein n=1 Tax=Sphingomonas gellani TaxID=1166340 RepID=A0A1H8C833_9SPHN|nr:PRC-barrel domain-containing protein [Sphingomonas gellani]SEM90247.1 hypothetical protein SAMN05192583_1465 [Sphingomonas gellani]